MSTNSLGKFRHNTSITIRYGDIDLLRHVNNAKYQTYTEEARIKYCQDVLEWDGNWETFNMILASFRIDYLQPLFLFDSLLIYTRCYRLGTKSFDLDYAFMRTNNEKMELMATAQTTLVTFDYQSQTTIPIPDAIRSKITEYERNIEF